MTTRRTLRGHIALSAAFAGLVAASGSLAGCGTDDVVYCGDDRGVVVDESRCDGDGADDGGSSFFIYRGSSYPGGLRAGDTLPPGGSRVAHTDSGGRTRAGLPARGGFGGNGGRCCGG